MSFVPGFRFLAVTFALTCGSISSASNAQDVSVPHLSVITREDINQGAPYPQCHASTITELPDGRLAAAWFGGTYEGADDVSIWYAVRNQNAWMPARKVATAMDTAGRGVALWNPVLFTAPDQRIWLFYKRGRSIPDWTGWSIQSTNSGDTWSPPHAFGPGVLGPIKNKPIILHDGAWLSGSSAETTRSWKVHFERSDDLGMTWTSGAPVAADVRAIQPTLLKTGLTEVESLVRTDAGYIGATSSKDGGRTWTKVAPTSLPNPNSGIDAVSLSNGWQLLVLNWSGQNPQTHGSGPRYPLSIAISHDGNHWKRVLDLETVPIAEGYAYPAVIQSHDGIIHVTYTVGRRVIRHVALRIE